MKQYLLNSAVLTSYGNFRYTPATIRDVADRLKRLPFTSAVGHAPTALLLSKLLKLHIPCQRIQICMQPGDVAVVFRLKQRLADYSELTMQQLTQLEFELGILTRLEEQNDR